MVERAVAEARETFLVEHYRPGHTVGELRQWAARVRDAAVELIEPIAADPTPRGRRQDRVRTRQEER